MTKQQVIIQSARMISKLDKYCRIVCSMTLEEKLKQEQQKFIEKCWEQIREIEDITDQDYLDIPEIKERRQ